MIIKTFKERDYASIENKVLNDKRLSYRARGILVYLLSKPSGWTVRSEDIVNNGTETRGMIRTCFRELKMLRYARLVPNPTGGSQWIICEDPGTRDAAYLNVATASRDATKSDVVVSPTLSKKEKKGIKTDSADFLISGQLSRLCAIFHKRPKTPLDRSEKTAWATLTNKGKRPLDEDELSMVERFYKRNWPPNRDKNNLRHALAQLMNNFGGEVDKARTWCAKYPVKSARKIVIRKDGPILEAALAARPPEMNPKETREFCDKFERQFKRLPAGYKREGEEIIFVGSANGAHAK